MIQIFLVAPPRSKSRNKNYFWYFIFGARFKNVHCSYRYLRQQILPIFDLIHLGCKSINLCEWEWFNHMINFVAIRSRRRMWKRNIFPRDVISAMWFDVLNTCIDLSYFQFEVNTLTINQIGNIFGETCFWAKETLFSQAIKL